MGRDPSIIAFHPADKTKLGKVMSKADSTNNLSMSANNARSNEDPLSDDEMEEEYRSVLIRKADRKNQLNESEVEASTSTLRYCNTWLINLFYLHLNNMKKVGTKNSEDEYE